MRHRACRVAKHENNKKRKHQYNSEGEAVVPETESTEKGYSKVSMHYMFRNSEDGDKAKSTMVVVSHGNGGIFAYATPSKGIQGDAY